MDHVLMIHVENDIDFAWHLHEILTKGRWRAQVGRTFDIWAAAV